jgi:hypothetical protein
VAFLLGRRICEDITTFLLDRICEDIVTFLLD